MNSSEKKHLHDSIKTFYDLNHDKGKPYTLKHFKNSGYRERQMFRIKKCVREMDINVIQKMFDHLKPKIHKANESGLGSLI